MTTHATWPLTHDPWQCALGRARWWLVRAQLWPSPRQRGRPVGGPRTTAWGKRGGAEGKRSDAVYNATSERRIDHSACAHMPATRTARARTRTHITGAEASLPAVLYGNTLASAGSSTMCSLMTRMAVVCRLHPTWPRRLQTARRRIVRGRAEQAAAGVRLGSCPRSCRDAGGRD